MKPYLIPPPHVTLEGYSYWKGYKSYSEFNYLRPGIASQIKRRHFEICLRLVSKYFHKVNVIDFGCADGYFLPSLAKYFNRVAAIDKNPDHIRIATEVVTKIGVNNVKVIHNGDLTLKELATKISDDPFHILFLLEVLEHIGDKTNMYKSKVNFLREVSTLVDDDGIIVISVPKMIGISFLIQRAGLTFFRINRERISTKDLIKAGIFNDTSNLEKQWNGDHLGFNHKKLEQYIRSGFKIFEKRNDLFQVIYVIGKRNAIHT